MLTEQAVAVFGVATRNQSDPYKFGVIISYVLTAALSEL